MAKETIAIVIDGQDNASDDIRRVQQNMGNLNMQAQKTTGGMKGFGLSMNASTLAMGGMVAGGIAAAKQLADITIQLNAVGKESRATSKIFTQLAGGIDEATELMQSLRNATQNVVDDTTLQAGASQLMRMGLAENASEVETLIDMALKLKQPTETASEAIENFSLMLANQSVARLDSFGISSSKVRFEMERLIQTGQALNREEAFKLAVLSEGANSIEALGDAVDAAVTEVDKLETRWSNFVSTLGEGVNVVVEDVAEDINDALEFSEQEIKTRPELMERGWGGSPFGASAYTDAQLEQNRAAFAALAEAKVIEETILEAQAQQIISQQRAFEHANAMQSLQTQKMVEETMLTHSQALRESAKSLALQSADAVAMGLANITPDFITDPYISANLGTINQELELYMQQITELEESGADVSDLKANVQDLASIWGGVTNAVNGSIAALERLGSLSLDDLLGRGAGDAQQRGLIGMLLGQVSDSDLRSALQSEFALLTGQETELGQVVEEEISRQIAEVASTVGSTAAYGMVEAVQNALQTGEFLGLDEDEIIELVRGATMATTPRSMLMRPSGGYTVQPGDSPWSILQGMGIPADQIQSMLGMFAPYGTLQPGMQIGLPGMGGGMGMLPSDAILTTGGMLGAPAIEPIEELVSDEAREEMDLLLQDFEAIDIKMNQIRQSIAVAFRDVTMDATINISANVSAEDKRYIDYVLGEGALNNLGQTPTNQPGGSPPSGGGGTNK